MFVSDNQVVTCSSYMQCTYSCYYIRSYIAKLHAQQHVASYSCYMLVLLHVASYITMYTMYKLSLFVTGSAKTLHVCVQILIYF